jgi:hypothetical protein
MYSYGMVRFTCKGTSSLLDLYSIPEDDPSGSKHVEDIKKLIYDFRTCAFRWFIVYNYIVVTSY